MKYPNAGKIIIKAPRTAFQVFGEYKHNEEEKYETRIKIRIHLTRYLLPKGKYVNIHITAVRYIVMM